MGAQRAHPHHPRTPLHTLQGSNSTLQIRWQIGKKGKKGIARIT